MAKTKTLLIINNIPTPYRVFMYQTLSVVARQYDIRVHVVFQARREKRRPWSPGDFTMQFGHSFSKRFLLNTPYEYFGRGTLNLDVLKTIIFGEYDFVMFPPSMCVTNWLGALAPAGKAKKLLYSEANLTSLKNDLLPIRLMRRILYSRFDAAVCPGERAFHLVDYHSFAPRRQAQIRLPNIVDTRLFVEEGRKERERRGALRQELRLPFEKKIIVSVGIAPCKGVSLALDAIANTPGDYEVLYLGEDPVRERYQAEVRSRGISGRVRFLGQQCDINVVRYLAAADWFFHPAVYDASPLACVEALCIGLPMAVSRQTGNSPEVVDEMLNGILFDPNDSGELRRSVAAMVNATPEATASMSAQSRRLADVGFDPVTVAQRFFTALRQMG